MAEGTWEKGRHAEVAGRGLYGQDTLQLAHADVFLDSGHSGPPGLRHTGSDILGRGGLCYRAPTRPS